MKYEESATVELKSEVNADCLCPAWSFICSITKQLALKLINQLLEERKIKKSGMARSVRYFIR